VFYPLPVTISEWTYCKDFLSQSFYTSVVRLRAYIAANKYIVLQIAARCHTSCDSYLLWLPEKYSSVLRYLFPQQFQIDFLLILVLNIERSPLQVMSAYRHGVPVSNNMPVTYLYHFSVTGVNNTYHTQPLIRCCVTI